MWGLPARFGRLPYRSVSIACIPTNPRILPRIASPRNFTGHRGVSRSRNRTRGPRPALAEVRQVGDSCRSQGERDPDPGRAEQCAAQRKHQACPGDQHRQDRAREVGPCPSCVWKVLQAPSSASISPRIRSTIRASASHSAMSSPQPGPNGPFSLQDRKVQCSGERHPRKIRHQQPRRGAIVPREEGEQ